MQRADFFQAIFYSATTISGVFSGLIAYGVQRGLEDTDGRSSWQWLFLIEGVIAVAIGLANAALLPSFPDRMKISRFISELEIKVALQRSLGMLTQSPPITYKWTGNNSLPLVYKYDFMPRGIITRLIVRLHKHIYTFNEEQMVWQTGVKIDGQSFGYKNTFAELIESWDSKKLLVKVHGSDSKSLISKLSHQIDELNDEYFSRQSIDESESIKCIKIIPCNCNFCLKTESKHFYEYDLLIFAQNKKVRDIQSPLSLENVNVLNLIESIFGKVPPKKNPYKLFISYSRADSKWKNELIKNLAALKNQELITTWHDKEIESGLWEPQIKDAMNNANIFLLVITQNFIASDYITSNEITEAYRKYLAKDALIFPIIFDSCDWKIQPISKSEKEFDIELNTEIFPSLGKFQALPKNGKPIKNWPNRQDGFLDIINQLKRSLNFDSK